MSAGTQDEAAVELAREVLDRAEIEQLVSAMGAVLDERRFEDFGDVFAEDVEARFPFGAVEGLAAMTEIARRTLGPYEQTQHAIADVLAELDGDRADVSANLIAVHVPSAAEPARHFDVGARYRFEVRRTEAGWRLARVELTPVWTSGVPAAAGHGA